MIALRIDDFGASSKQYEVYSLTQWANVGPLKRLRPFKAWGPYPEMPASLLHSLLGEIERAGSRVTLGITACWVERDGRQVAYPTKFPLHAEVVKTWIGRGVVEVANHGLTHCRVGQHRPKFWTGNRAAHREFTPDVSLAEASNHLLRSQQIFRGWLDKEPAVLIPPGRMFPAKFMDAARLAGLKVWTRFDDEKCLAFHDKDFLESDGFARLRRALGEAKYVTCGEVLA